MVSCIVGDLETLSLEMAVIDALVRTVFVVKRTPMRGKKPDCRKSKECVNAGR
jgi:hypothetical protein